MAAVNANMIKELRERTGLGMIDCKKALKEADGDIEQAIEQLRKSSGMKAAKKAGRIAAEGAIAIRIGEQYAQIVEVNSETDFVARDDGFRAFVNNVADHSMATKQTDVSAVMAGELELAREALVQKIGENISPRRIAAIEAGVLGSYIHAGDRIGVIVGLRGGDESLAKDIAMHTAAVNPQYISPEHVPADVIEKEKSILIAQSEDSGKPQNIIEKMVEGRIRKFLADISLTEQAFVKKPDVTIKQLLKDSEAEVVSFIRFEVGEGIEKNNKDFAIEVAEQLANA